jgi:hypothetical protein
MFCLIGGQNTTQKTKYSAMLKQQVNSGDLEVYAVPAPLVAPVMLFLVKISV